MNYIYTCTVIKTDSSCHTQQQHTLTFIITWRFWLKKLMKSLEKKKIKSSQVKSIKTALQLIKKY